MMNKKSLGIFFAISGALCFAVMGYFVQISSDECSRGFLLLSRAIFGVIILSFILKSKISCLFKKEALYIWLRAIFGAISVSLFYWNLRNTNLATATLLTDLSPVFVVIFLSLLYCELPTMSSVIGVLMSVIGLGMLSMVGVSNLTVSNIGFGIGSAATSALAFISIKRASTAFQPASIVWAFCLMLVVPAILDPQGITFTGSWIGLLKVIAVVLMSLVAQFLMTLSYRYLSAASASTLGLTSSIWSLGIDFLLNDVGVTIYQIMSMIICLLGINILQRADNAR